MFLVVPSHPKLVRRDIDARLLNIAYSVFGGSGKRFGGPTSISSLRATTVACTPAPQQPPLICTAS